MPALPLKYVSLLTLVVQNSALVLVMRYSRLHSGQTGESYYTSTAVFLAELTKLILSIGLYMYEELQQRQDAAKRRHQGYELAASQRSRLSEDEHDMMDPAGDAPFADDSRAPLTLRTTLANVFGDDAWKLMIPAALYTIQNNLQYVAVSLLDAATFQVTYQLKILTTALCFVIILRKPLNRWQWGSLVVLTLGVILVQLPSLTTSASGAPGADTSSQDKARWEQFLGLVTVALACLMSGLAGVYFEKILKGSKTSLWIRNIQLSFFSLFPALLLGVMIKDGAGVREHGFWYGYNGWTFGAIACQAIGGIIVALVVKYADNILKGFATSISIIVSCVLSIFIFDFVVTPLFVLGTIAVIFATYLYSRASALGAPKPAPVQRASSESESTMVIAVHDPDETSDRAKHLKV
ncbi:UDP-galactose transporter Gms1 [Dimargaris xerosporica]|nr:UDP-galactose transporter Gms1 [Dimargaris xerosporica]